MLVAHLAFPHWLCGLACASCTVMSMVVPEDVSQFGTLQEVLDFAKFPAEKWTEVTTQLGEPDLDELMIVAALPDAEWQSILPDVLLSAVAKVRLNLVVNIIRKVNGTEVSNIFGSPPPVPPVQPAPAPPAVSVTVTKEDDSSDLPARQYFDQGSRRKFKPKSETELRAARARWVAVADVEPRRELNPIDNQLSVILGIVEVGDNPLAFDMGVWGPFGVRRERHWMCTTHHLNAAGQYVPQEMAGAGDLEDWLFAWEFATVTLVMAKVGKRGCADRYRDNFKELCKAWPRSWWICMQAEWEYRHEFAVEEVRRQAEFHEQVPNLSGYNPEMKWNSVLLAADSGKEAEKFWDSRLKTRARLWQDSPEALKQPSWISRQEALAGPLGSTAVQQQAVAPAGQVAAGSGGAPSKRQLKRKWRQEIHQTPPADAPPQSGRSQEKAWYDWVNEKHPDGRFKRAEDGKDFCFLFGRNKDGCTTVCSTTPPRSHTCEWCRGPHRSISCSTHPDWEPPQANPKGGKNRGGKGKKGKTHK